MRIAVIDGQGGGIGKAVVERLAVTFQNNVEILALGTNALATSAMLKAGGNRGATGENAIVVCAPKVDVIIGVIGILSANSMLGELTPAMAKAISESPAEKILIPLNRCRITVAGMVDKPLPHYIDDVVRILKERMGGMTHV